MANGVAEPNAQNNENIGGAPENGGNQQNNNAGGEGGNQQNNDAAGLNIRSNLQERIEKKEEQILKLEASVFELANYYFVFQGVILAAIVKGSSGGLKCHHFWMPLSLSFIGAALNFGSLLIIADKYKESLDQLDDRQLELQKHLDPEAGDMLSEEHKKKRARRRGIMVISMISFLIFVFLSLVATRIIPCHS
ncbi:hypothetical protein CDL12_03991 [Handroanthus impetiginosus]|uniref:Transmembrane protein n=1 Tax=Handroanthus impetiginosus TaxID=429701 RepID=A0A2G9I0K3_9LAMI|nr:hypothetical protein CDL12_03991 [Handroanthus impetiginosus]